MWSGGHLPESGVIYTVKELSEKCQDPGVMQGESVRVNGRLVEHKVGEKLAKILDRNKDFCLWINTELIEPIIYPMGAAIQFVGEIEWRENLDPLLPLLKARTVRCVDNLDLILYEKALAIQRNYFQEESVGVNAAQKHGRQPTEMEQT